MASIQPTESGKWKVYVTVNYKVKTKTFRTKGEAQSWAALMESSMSKGHGVTPDITYKDLLEKYRDEVSPTKKNGGDKEIVRINSFIRDNPELCAIKIAQLSRKHFSTYRDTRLKTVSGATVTREFNLLSNVFRRAIDDWDMLKENPLSTVNRPKPKPGRDRRISTAEIDLLTEFSGYTDNPPEKIMQRVIAAFLFAIETAMRAQEICGLRVMDINGVSASVRDSKTSTGVRRVPLSKRALQIIEQMKRVDLPGDSIFHLKPSQIDSNFRKLTKSLMIKDLHFHDTRHEAMTRIARKVPVLDLARITGIKDLKILMVYYNATAEDIAPLLD